MSRSRSNCAATYLTAEPVQRRIHYFGVELLTVLGHDQVARLVDQPHGEQLACMYRTIRIFVGLAHLIHAMRERPAGSQIGKDNIPVEREKSVYELIPLTGGSRNMEFHHETVRSRP